MVSWVLRAAAGLPSRGFVSLCCTMIHIVCHCVENATQISDARTLPNRHKINPCKGLIDSQTPDIWRAQGELSRRFLRPTQAHTRATFHESIAIEQTELRNQGKQLHLCHFLRRFFPDGDARPSFSQQRVLVNSTDPKGDPLCPSVYLHARRLPATQFSELA